MNQASLHQSTIYNANGVTKVNTSLEAIALSSVMNCFSGACWRRSKHQQHRQ